MAFEFLGRRVLIVDDEFQLAAGGHGEFTRFEPMVLDDEFELGVSAALAGTARASVAAQSAVESRARMAYPQ